MNGSLSFIHAACFYFYGMRLTRSSHDFLEQATDEWTL